MCFRKNINKRAKESQSKHEKEGKHVYKASIPEEVGEKETKFRIYLSPILLSFIFSYWPQGWVQVVVILQYLKIYIMNLSQILCEQCIISFVNREYINLAKKSK